MGKIPLKLISQSNFFNDNLIMDGDRRENYIFSQFNGIIIIESKIKISFIVFYFLTESLFCYLKFFSYFVRKINIKNCM